MKNKKITVNFQKHIDWRYICSNSRKRFLTDIFTFEINDYKYCISKGFWTDSASIPRAVWTLIGSPFTGRYVIPALIHDVLYGSHHFPRKKCDRIFYEAMRKCHVPRIKAWLIYINVRMWGWIAYKSKTKDEIKGASKHLSVYQ